MILNFDLFFIINIDKAGEKRVGYNIIGYQSYGARLRVKYSYILGVSKGDYTIHVIYAVYNITVCAVQYV